MTPDDSACLDGIEVRPLTVADLPQAIRLKEQENWNQTEADWKRLLEPDSGGCLAACVGERVVGTVTTAMFGADLAWIGMMLVDRDFRRRGIARRLLRLAISRCGEAGIRRIKLDATPAGRPVYESLGFVSETMIERWGRVEGKLRARDHADNLRPRLSVMSEELRQIKVFEAEPDAKVAWVAYGSG